MAPIFNSVSQTNNINWTDILCCSICTNTFNLEDRRPITLICSHSLCTLCAANIESCPLDQCKCCIPARNLAINRFLESIICGENHEQMKDLDPGCLSFFEDEQNLDYYLKTVDCLQHMAAYFRKANAETGGSIFSPSMSRPMQRKLLSLACCQFLELEGRMKAMKSARALAERVVTELLLLHQNPNHLSSHLWSAVRARGCQFLGPAMQEEVLKLILLTLSEGASIARKTLVLYIVQTLAKEYPQASKTSVGHVVQLLYRASCFNVVKRDGESSLMQLKEEYRLYDDLRKEHDSQIVQMANEAGLRISPDQWSSLLYGDQGHRSHMQSIIDKLQSPETFTQSVEELAATLNKYEDKYFVNNLISNLHLLNETNLSESDCASYEMCYKNVSAACNVLHTLIKHSRDMSSCPRSLGSSSGSSREFDNRVKTFVTPNTPTYPETSRYKTCMCREVLSGNDCPRAKACTFAHSYDELQLHRSKSRNSTFNRPPTMQQQPYMLDTNRPPPPLNLIGPNRMMPQAIEPQQYVQCDMPVQAVTAQPQNYIMTGIIPHQDLQPTQPMSFPANPLNPLMHRYTPPPPTMMGVPAAGINEQGEIAMGTLLVPINQPPVVYDPPQYLRTPSSDSEVEKEVLPHMMAKREEILRRLNSMRRSSEDEEERSSSAELSSHVSWACAISVLDFDDHQFYAPPMNVSADLRVPIRGPSPINAVPANLTSGPGPSHGSTPQQGTSSGLYVMNSAIGSNECSTTLLPVTLDNTSQASGCEGLHTNSLSNHPVPTSQVMSQGFHHPAVSYEVVNPQNIVYQLPPVLKAPNVSQQFAVGSSINRIVEVKSRLNSNDMLNPPSNVEKQHLQMELKLMNQQLDTMDRPTEAACLIRELQNVNCTIDQFKYC